MIIGSQHPKTRFSVAEQRWLFCWRAVGILMCLAEFLLWWRLGKASTAAESTSLARQMATIAGSGLVLLVSGRSWLDRKRRHVEVTK